MATKPTHMPIHIIVLTAFIAATGLLAAVYQIPMLAAPPQDTDRAFTFALLVGGTAGVAAGAAVWRRATWVMLPLAVWVAAPAVLMLSEARGKDRLTALLVTGVLILVAWYLNRWTVGAARSRGQSPAAEATARDGTALPDAEHVPTRRLLHLPVLLPAGILGPIVLALLAVTTRELVSEDAGSLLLYLLPFGQLAFVLGGARLAATEQGKATFVAVASIVAVMATAVAWIGSMAP